MPHLSVSVGRSGRIRLRGILPLLIAHAIAACNASSTPAAPTVAPPATGAAPTVTSISPTLGSTSGGTEVKITGSGLRGTVTFGGAVVQGRFDSRYPGALMLLSSPAHAPGTVDVVVTGQNGDSLRLANAFTYASPQTFDFNGAWSGFGRNGQDNLIRFTILDNMLLGVSCDSVSSAPDAIVIFSPPKAVTNNEFSVAESGVSFSGRLVSPSAATGVIRLGECASDAWYAVKQ